MKYLNTVFKHGFCNVFFADGDGGGGGGAPEWHGDYSYISENPEASKAFSKYENADAAFKGAHEAMKKVGKPYWLPDDHSSLTDQQKADINANVSKMNGVPEAADGYVIDVPPDTKSPIDAQAIADFKMFCKENNVPPALAQKTLGFQLALMDKVNELQDEARKSRAKEGFASLSKTLGGDDKAIAAMQQIMEYLQSHCKDSDGKPDPKMWESFKERMFFEDKIVDDVLS
ncbi:MAG: hypothetical protein GWN13_13040, partial [Phycisphaerae bacterium]|nr:hypothetical protein [Phycisphaerae bacterium]